MGALAAIGLAVRRERREARSPAAPVVVAMPSEHARASRRWGGLVPGLLLLALALARLRSDPTVKAHDQEVDDLYKKASRAYEHERFADAAEYARHAVFAGPQSPLRFELLCLRGESLLRAGQPLDAAQAFDAAQPLSHLGRRRANLGGDLLGGDL